MAKKVLALLVGALMLIAVTTALAATKAIKVSGTMYASISKTTGAKATITGFSQDRSLGTTMFLFKSAGLGKGVKTPVTIYSTKGTVSGTAVADDTATPTGITIANGVFSAKSGTGVFKGTVGTVKFAGTESKSNTFTIAYSGSLKIKQ